jgi:hypothetical protein
MEKKAGRRLVVQVEGRAIPCGTIGEYAQAIGRSVHWVRANERNRFTPPAPLVLVSDKPQAVRRLYPLVLIDAVREVAERENFGTRRPSGKSREQSEALYDVWTSVMADLFDDDGVTEPIDETA